MRYIPDDNLAYPLLIERKSGTGSGFTLNTQDYIFLVTAKHVLFKENGEFLDSSIYVTGYSSDFSTKFILNLDLQVLQNNNHIKQHDNVDAVSVNIGSLISNPKSVKSHDGVSITKDPPNSDQGMTGMGLENCRNYADVLVSNEVFLFGYPRSLGLEGQNPLLFDPDRPLLRKGIVAGKNDATGMIIIDCPVYQGNSGGLVIEVVQETAWSRRFFGIGIAVQFIPFVEYLKSLRYGTVNTSIDNSGYSVVVPMDRLLDLV